MNNFTKSIVYSGVVLAAGLVAIFAIYNNVSSNSSVSYIEPAAGTEAVEGISEGAANLTGSITDASGEAVSGASETISATAANATETASGAAEATTNAADAMAEKAGSTVSDAIQNAKEAATPSVTTPSIEAPVTEETMIKAEDAAIEAVADKADEIEEAAKEAAQDKANEIATDAAQQVLENAEPASGETLINGAKSLIE